MRPPPLPATASRPKTAVTLGLWLDGSILVPITGHRPTGSCPVVIAWLWSLPSGETTEVRKIVSLRCFSPADHGAAAMVAFARHKGNGKVFDGWVFGCQNSDLFPNSKGQFSPSTQIFFEIFDCRVNRALDGHNRTPLHLRDLCVGQPTEIVECQAFPLFCWEHGDCPM